MAEENNQSAELDTDGVNEQTINVETPDGDTTAFEKKEDVDLGYTDVSNQKTAKELLQETKNEPKEQPKQVESKDTDEEGLQEYSDKVQKRIKKLTFQIREAERREKAAVDYAKGLKNKYETAQEKYEEVDTNYLKEYDARIDAEDVSEEEIAKFVESMNAQQFKKLTDFVSTMPTMKKDISFTCGSCSHNNEQTLAGISDFFS